MKRFCCEFPNYSHMWLINGIEGHENSDFHGLVEIIIKLQIKISVG